MDEEIVNIQLPKAQYDALKEAGKDWPAFQDYVKRQNELDAVLEKQKKQRKTFMSFMELFILIGVISISVLSVLGFLVTLYFAFVGIQIGALPLILGFAAFILFGLNIFQFIRVWQSGEWFKFGLDLRKWKDGFFGFTKGRGILLVAGPYKQKQEFRKGIESTLFLAKTKGYHDSSTGATIRTVREGSISDFDVEEEYSGDIDEIGKDVKTISQEGWFGGAIWNKIDLPQLKVLLIIAIIVAGVAALMAAGAIAIGYQTGETLSKQLVSLDGNLSQKIAAITINNTAINSPGVIT